VVRIFNGDRIHGALSQVDSEVTVTTELLPQEVLVPAFTKSKNRGHLAAILASKLFDEETLIKSNVLGRRKEKLDPEIIQYIKAKCFFYFPSQGSNKEEWVKCIQNIDDKSRAIRRKRKNKV